MILLAKKKFFGAFQKSNVDETINIYRKSFLNFCIIYLKYFAFINFHLIQYPACCSLTHRKPFPSNL